MSATAVRKRKAPVECPASLEHRIAAAEARQARIEARLAEFESRAQECRERLIAQRERAAIEISVLRERALLSDMIPRLHQNGFGAARISAFLAERHGVKILSDAIQKRVARMRREGKRGRVKRHGT